jgi:hypothetical protein
MGFWRNVARGISDTASAASGGRIAAQAVPIIEEITGRPCDDEDKESLMKTSTTMGKYGYTKYDYAFDFLRSMYFSDYGTPVADIKGTPYDDALKEKICSLAKQHIRSGDITSPPVKEAYEE